MVLLLIVWFKTEAFIIYSKVFKLDTIFHINDWETYKTTQDCSVSYIQYLKITYKTNFYKNFFISLISCPICLSFWICLPSILLFGVIYYPIIIISTLITYYLLVLLMQ